MPVFRRNPDGTIEEFETWESVAERKIQEAHEAGAFDNLSPRGRPQDLAENPFEGERWLAHRLLKNANAAPLWIEELREIDAATRALDETLEHARRRLRTIHPPRGYPTAEWIARERLRLRELHGALRAAYADEIARLNRKIDTFNLMVPVVWLQKRRLDLREQLARFDAAAVPADPAACAS